MSDLKWCLNDDPHSEHWVYNEFNGRNYCSGRPEGGSVNEYTPTTDEIIRSFSIPPHRVIERTDGESFADYLSRLSIEGHGYQMQSDAAAHRWLTEHDRQVAERAWDEGYNAGHYVETEKHECDCPRANPYRKNGRSE